MEANIERYDRQIRLWGQHGQNKCSDARVCLINCDSLGAEILKGLCLAGIAGFTILDSNRLTDEDMGSLFIPQNSIGKSRGETVKDMLQRINSDVIGQVQPVEKYLTQIIDKKCDSSQSTSEESYIHEHINFWKQFNIVIVSGCLNVNQIKRISKICWNISVPLIVSKSIGFFATMRIQVEDHVIIETHPDSPLPDFRLDSPFQDLKGYLESIDIDDTTKLDKINTYPYVVIIYHYLRKWQNDKGFKFDRLPQTVQEKTSLKSYLNNGLKQIYNAKKLLQPNDCNQSQEVAFENFQEASKAINSCFSISHDLPRDLENLFQDPRLKNPFETSRPTFWVILSAIKQFYTSRSVYNALPVSGAIPDMIASSEEYLRLQSIYLKKAREDVEEIFNIVQNKIPPGSYPHGQSLFEEIKLLCKNIRDLKMISTTPIETEYDFKLLAIKEDFEDDEAIAIGLAMKALDIFYTTYSRLPGLQSDQVETDISKLKDCLKSIIGKSSNKLKNLDQSLYEICRVGGAELHATSAFMGGCIAQEAIKFITNQYVTVNDTMIYNAMTASAQCLKFSEAFRPI